MCLVFGAVQYARPKTYRLYYNLGDALNDGEALDQAGPGGAKPMLL